MATLRLALAQHDFPVGAVDANARRVLELAAEASARGACLAVFPELSLCGYPAEDLLLREGFLDACEAALQHVGAHTTDTALLVGHPQRIAPPAPVPDASASEPPLHNAATLWRNGRVLARYAKHALPDYGVFDEKRYFTPGTQTAVADIDGVRMGLLICEDIWIDRPARAACEAGAQLLVVINASPYSMDKQAERIGVLQHQARTHGVGIAYLNATGGQDELLFDGASLLVDADGSVAASAPVFMDALLLAEYDTATARFRADNWPPCEADATANLYAGLVRGIRDYVRKNGFGQVLLGLSGGIDSALTLALAVDALGAQSVAAVMMPSPFTSRLSLEGASEQAVRLGVAYRTLSIEPAFEAMLKTLQPAFDGKPADLTEENLQSRLRGALLMALSNKHGSLLLATGNKSEMAVGYATLYGDMCGAYAPLKDVYKTEVYRLARWRNHRAQAAGEEPCIPWRVIERPPSAELRADQTDQDALPPYDELDAILKRFIEDGLTRADIAAAGFDDATVDQIVTLVLRNEFKRRQSAPGPKVTACAFGRERRYPITSAWKCRRG